MKTVKQMFNDGKKFFANDKVWKRMTIDEKASMVVVAVGAMPAVVLTVVPKTRKAGLALATVLNLASLNLKMAEGRIKQEMFAEHLANEHQKLRVYMNELYSLTNNEEVFELLEKAEEAIKQEEATA